jgi:hypothetical protein
MDLVPIFLQYACWDHHERFQGVARDSLYTAIVCGLTNEVERNLNEVLKRWME